jgi:hypothetical protein
VFREVSATDAFQAGAEPLFFSVKSPVPVVEHDYLNRRLLTRSDVVLWDRDLDSRVPGYLVVRHRREGSTRSEHEQYDEREREA